MQSTVKRRLSCDEDLWKAFESTFSEARLKFYLDVASASDPKATLHKRQEIALTLCQWNVELCEALYVPLQYLEVALRNRLAPVLDEVYTDKWFIQPPPRHEKAVQDAITIVKRDKNDLKDDSRFYSQFADEINQGPTNVNNVIPAISFGAWVAILKDDSAIRAKLPQIFTCVDQQRLATPKFQDEIFDKLDTMRKLRNRIAHHGAIFDLDLGTMYRDLDELIMALCKTTGEAMQRRSYFLSVWQSQPETSIVIAAKTAKLAKKFNSKR